MKAVALLPIAALVFFLVGQAFAGDPLARYDDHSTKGLTRVSGPIYVNSNYGYLVDIPAGQAGWMDTPPSPNHGFNIYLGDRRSIEIEASFDSAFLGSTSAVAEEIANYVSGAQNVKASETLGGQPATRISQVFAGSDRRRVIVARWNDAGGAGDAINFVLTLETTNQSYQIDNKTFDALIGSFRFIRRRP